MFEKLQHLLAQATEGATANQLQLITWCVVITAAYAIGRTAFFLWQKLQKDEAEAPSPEAVAAASRAEPVLAPQPLGGPIDPKLIAILAAAATVALGKRVAIRRVTFINHNTVSGWAEAGRLGIHSSHNIRR